MSNSSRTIDADVADAELRAADCPNYLIGFGRALDTVAGGPDWPYFLEKPWKWASEYAVWVNNDYPTDSTDDGWDVFCTALGAS